MLCTWKHIIVIRVADRDGEVEIDILMQPNSFKPWARYRIKYQLAIDIPSNHGSEPIKSPCQS